MIVRQFGCLVMATLVMACDAPLPVATPAPTRSDQLAPEGAPPGTCWGRVSSPAVVESVTEQVLVTPAKVNPDGTIASLPVYRSEDRQQIVTPRQDRWFETPCPPAFTVEFVSSLQRALTARRIYGGPINGTMDVETRRAVRNLQAAGGLDSDVLSLETARSLGLVISPGSATQ